MHVGKQSPILGYSCFFSKCTLLLLQSWLCSKHYKIMFATEHSFVYHRITPSRCPFPNWHFWNQKYHFGFSPVPAESPFFVVFGMVTKESAIFPIPKQIDSCNENARFFFTFRTQTMFVNFPKKFYFEKKHRFVHNHPKNTLFCFFFLIFTNKCTFLGKNKQKSWTKLWPNLGPSFDSKTPNLGPHFDSTTYVYICIYRENEEKTKNEKRGKTRWKNRRSVGATRRPKAAHGRPIPWAMERRTQEPNAPVAKDRN